MPNVRREEGPFGEFTGHAVSKDERPVIEASAITHRKNYIFQDVHAGYTEHKLMGAVPREAALIRAVRQKQDAELNEVGSAGRNVLLEKDRARLQLRHGGSLKEVWPPWLERTGCAPSGRLNLRGSRGYGSEMGLIP